MRAYDFWIMRNVIHRCSTNTKIPKRFRFIFSNSIHFFFVTGMSSKVDQIIRHQTMRALQISVCHAVKGKKVWKAISWCLNHNTLESFYCTKFTIAISYMSCLNPWQQCSAWYVSFCLRMRALTMNSLKHGSLIA